MEKTSKTKTKGKRQKSFKTELILSILALIAIPLIAAIVISSVSSVRNQISSEQEIALNRAGIVQEEVEAIINENFRVLEVLATNPTIIDFLQNTDDEEKKAAATEAVIAANDVFHDANPTHLSQPDGWQLIRSDGLECKDISTRAYFQAAMKGEEVMSEVLISLATGAQIDVIIVPVKDEKGNVIGAVQRDYGLTVLSEFTKEAATENSRVAIIENNGLLMSHSDREVAGEEDRTDYSEEAFFQRAVSGETGTMIDEYNGSKYIFAYMQDPTTGWIIATTADYNTVMSKALMSSVFIIIISIILLLGAGAVGYYIAQRFSKPILAVSKVAHEAANGNLGQDPLDIKNNNELGSMANAFNDMTENFADVIDKTRTATGELNAESTSLHSSAAQASDATEHVSGAIREISEGAATQAASVQDAATHAASMGNDIDEISGNSAQLDSSSAEMEKACEAAMVALNKLIQQSEEVTTSVAEIGGTIQSTNSSAQQISEFTDAISSIASQTNLLSLNASIEAARAGEAGKGFAVVAQEISKLAEQSSQAADQIKSIVDSLLENSESSVKVLDKLNVNFSAQSEMLSATKEDMESLERNATEVSESSGHITQKIDSLNLAKEGLVGIIEELRDISERNAASAQETNASMQELHETFSVISESSDKLQGLANELKETISYYNA